MTERQQQCIEKFSQFFKKNITELRFVDYLLEKGTPEQIAGYYLCIYGEDAYNFYALSGNSMSSQITTLLKENNSTICLM